MMNAFILPLVVIGLLAVGTMRAQALVFIDNYNFSGSGVDEGRDYQAFSGTLAGTFPSFAHELSELSPGSTLTSATLRIWHKQNDTSTAWCLPRELWLVSAEDGGLLPTFLGKLGTDSRYSWQYDSFALRPDLLAYMSRNYPWRLEIRMLELTTGKDDLWLDKSELEVNYNAPAPAPAPVPEPGSLLLSAMGLAGLAGAGFVIRRPGR